MKIDMNDVLEIKKALEFYVNEQHWIFIDDKDVLQYERNGYVVIRDNNSRSEVIERGNKAQTALNIIENYLVDHNNGG